MAELDALGEKVNGIDVRVARLEEAQPFLKDMMERSTESNERLADALHGLETTMVSLNSKIDAQSTALEELKADLDNANQETANKIAGINKRVSAVEERSKFDIMEYLKKNFHWIVVILGLGIAYASQYVKF